MATTVVKSVIKFSSSYNHNVRTTQRIQASTSKSKNLPAMKKAYEDYKYAFNNSAIPDGYLSGEKKEIYMTAVSYTHLTLPTICSV